MSTAQTKVSSNLPGGIGFLVPVICGNFVLSVAPAYSSLGFLNVEDPVRAALFLSASVLALLVLAAAQGAAIGVAALSLSRLSSNVLYCALIALLAPAFVGMAFPDLVFHFAALQPGYGGYDLYLPGLLSTLVSTFGVLSLRTLYLSVPRDYKAAARLDGVGAVQLFWKVYLPLSIGTMSVIVVLLFFELLVSGPLDRLMSVGPFSAGARYAALVLPIIAVLGGARFYFRNVVVASKTRKLSSDHA